MLGIVITTFNRPEYLRETFQALTVSVLPKGTLIVIVDDASRDQETVKLINEFCIKGCLKAVIAHKTNKRTAYGIKEGFEYCFANGCELAINLDADAIVRPDWVKVLTKLHQRFPEHIVTGFNSLNVNLKGEARHPILKTGKGFHFKSSVGGINMLVNEQLFKKYILPACNKVIAGQGNWDYLACLECMKDQHPVVVSTPSVVQHIAGFSSMGHLEEPDVAADFFLLELPEVTMIGLDCYNVDRLTRVADYSTRFIKFGAVHLLSSQPSPHRHVVPVHPVRSKEEYSEFMFRELVDYFQTEHVLVIQHDGYVIDWKAWTPEFLRFGYVGATWWFKDNMNVGNGGFSLRSLKLQKLLATDKAIQQTHPEDYHIGRTYRRHLESKGIRFATEDIANRFSIEAHNSPDKNYSGQFGFHGKGVKFPANFIA